MKKLFFLLVLCLVSINIYAQRDTIFCLESKIPVVLSIPDSVCSPDATLEQNVKVWITKKPVTLYGGRDVIEFDWFKVYRYPAQEILFFSSTTQKNEIAKKNEMAQKNITTRVNYFLEIMIFYLATCFFITLLLFTKSIKKDLEEKCKQENDNISKFYKSSLMMFKYCIIPLTILLCIVIASIFLEAPYFFYSFPGLFLPSLIFLAGVMTPVIVRKIYRAKKQKNFPERSGDWEDIIG